MHYDSIKNYEITGKSSKANIYLYGVDFEIEGKPYVMFKQCGKPHLAQLLKDEDWNFYFFDNDMFKRYLDDFTTWTN